MPRPSLSSSMTGGSDEINVSPLIDVVFMLLLFFIVTSTFVEEVGVEIDKPEATASVSLEKQSIQLAITKEGKIVYGGQEIGIQGVRSVVRRLVQADEAPVIILADKVASADMVVRVIDEAKLGGATKVSLSTQ
jgi:biopolymer transport protein ExbD